MKRDIGRWSPPSLYLDLAVFYNDYDNLVDLGPETITTDSTPAPAHFTIHSFLGPTESKEAPTDSRFLPTGSPATGGRQKPHIRI